MTLFSKRDNMQDLLYLPAQGVQFKDLFDWSNHTEKCKQTTTVINTKGLHVQTKESGSLTECNLQEIALFRHGQNVYAIKEKCPHAGGPLHQGDIEDLGNGELCVKCPWHGWKFDLLTGEVKFPAGHSKSAYVYPVQVKETGEILIGFERLAEEYFKANYDF